MDFFTNFVIYFGSGVIVGMIIGVYCIIDDERIRQVYLRFSEEDDYSTLLFFIIIIILYTSKEWKTRR